MKISFPNLLLTLLLASCGITDPVKDTSVNRLLDPAVAKRAVTGESPSVAVARPSLPGYLDRQQLVSRSGNGQLRINDLNVWAEPLDTGIARVTAANLGRLKNSLNIQPVESFVSSDYQSLLEIRVARFEPDAPNNLVLECTWKLQPVSGKVADTHPFTTSVPITPAATANDLSGVVTAMNEALARLARQIAKAM